MNRLRQITTFTMLLFLFALFIGCKPQSHKNNNSRLFTDVLGRTVTLPDSIRRIIPLNESTMRLVSYVGATSLVCGIEDVEIRGVAFTHIFANPELRQQPIIGPMGVGDAELILLQQPDVVIVSNISAAEADEMQQRLCTPVVVIGYGDMGRKRDELYEGIGMMGDLLGRKTKADSLVTYIRSEVDELQRRSAQSSAPNAYLGGISYKGRHDILSTDPHYAPFEMVNLSNTAQRIDATKIPAMGNTTIDLETLIDWNPRVMFIDQGGYRLVKNNFDSFSALPRLLDCYKNKQIYLLWPYYMFHSNFEIMLINAWNVGKVMHPEAFADIDMRVKADEILTRFVGKPVTEKLIEQWGWFRNISDEL